MMMRMLEAGGLPVLTDGIREADADNPRGYYEYEPVKRTKDDPSWLDGARGAAVKMVYRLLYDLPPDGEYRVIFMRRRIEEVLASQQVMLARRRAPEGGAGEAEIARMLGIEIDRITRWLAESRGFQSLDVDFNVMMLDARPVLEKVGAFLGGGLDVDAMTAIVEPQLYRQRR
jgi:hypothetical protein